MRLGVFAFVIALFGVAAAQAQTTLPPAAATVRPQGARVGLALVIDNSAYAQGELPSVELDGTRMEAALKSLGFSVHRVQNLEKAQDFEDALESFLRAENAAPEDTLVVYYSGHGLQLDSRAYVLGTGTPKAAEAGASLREYSEDLERIVRIMEDSAPTARVLIVDACRNNVFPSTGGKGGVALRHEIEDTYLLFADQPGKTVPARSDSTEQSPFTAGLLYAFENSDRGIEERFRIARDKTRELNPDQNPQLIKSDVSANRDRPFLDHGGRSAALGSAGQLLNDAESLYQSASWDLFRDKISAARVLSTEATLTKRLDDELAFCDLVAAARRAETDPTGPKWAEAARSWQGASVLFPARLWVLERAAVDWLQADDLTQAAGILGHLRAQGDNPTSKRAGQMLAPLVQLEPGLDAVIKAAAKDGGTNLGPEFERYVKGMDKRE